MYLDGFKITLGNAKRLFAAAEALENTKEYPIANSLLVLSAEESMKAFAVLTQYLFPDKKFSSSDKVFRDHQHKLEAIAGLKMMIELTNKMWDMFYFPIVQNALNPVKGFKKKRKEN